MPRPAPGERAVAVDILTEVTDNTAYANITLRQTLAYFPQLDTRSRAFVTELVNGTLRNLLRVDYILSAFSHTPVDRMKPFIRALLRVSVYQLRFMDKVPASAAVNEAVSLAKARGFTPLSGFVNGVLRSVARQPDKPALPSFTEDPARHIGLCYSCPAWLAEWLMTQLGPARALAFCDNSHKPAPVAVFTNLLKTTPESLSARLRAEGVTCEPGTFFDECLRLRHTADLSQLAAYKEGLFHVMDEGALFAVKALQPRPGMRVLDLCAAPGGKTAACACLMADTGYLGAYDIHPHKLLLLNETLSRLGITCVTAALHDATTRLAGTEPADAVLLDAPCSGLGILRKRPEIKYTRTAGDIIALAEKQRAMLAAAAESVKPGGTLVYCTCTVTREENIDNIRWFTARYPFTAAPLPLLSYGENNPNCEVEDNCLQIWPGSDHDGFFIARLTRGAC